MASKTSNLKQVTPDDFDINILRQAALEGRLFISQATDSQTIQSQRNEGINQILTYVSRIDTCVSPQYVSVITQLWNHILYSEELGGLFFFQRYASSRGKVNWFRVNAVVTTMLEMGVYRKQDFTAVQLHLLMEQTTRRTNHYTGMSRYLLARNEIMTLKGFLKKFQQ